MSEIKNPVLYMVLLFCAALFAAGCVSSKQAEKEAPQWIFAADSVYPAAAYLNAVGEAPDRASAENAALALLAKSISQSVRSESRAQEFFTESPSGSGYGRIYSGSVETISSVRNIAGISIREVWASDDKSVFYALAQLDREKSGRVYKSKIDANTKVIVSDILFADEHTGSLEAYGALRKAEELARENDIYMDILAGIHPDLHRLIDLPYISAAAVQTLAERQRKFLTVSVSVSGDSGGRIAGALSAAASRSGFPVSDDTADTRYRLSADVSFAPAAAPKNYASVRYTIRISLTDTKKGADILPFSGNGRETHLTSSEAEEMAYRTMEKLIEETYAQKLIALAGSRS